MAWERFCATYRIETPLAPAKAAEVLSGEQSSGTFVAIPGESDALRERFGARVESVEPEGEVDSPGLPGVRPGKGPFHRAVVRISWSTENTGANLGAIASTVAGNLFELSQFSGLKLLDLDIPPSIASAFAGPRFGIDGTRRFTGVSGRPMIGTIIKPSVGLTPEQTAELVDVLAGGGIDFVKDDELMTDPPHSPFERRLEAVMAVINRHADRTGRKVMYAANITGEVDDMLRRYDRIVKLGGTCAMLSLNAVGISGVKKITDQGRLAIHGHRNMFGALHRHPLIGIDFPAYQKIWRLAGVDQIHVNGIANKFWEPDDSVVNSIRSCLDPQPGGRPLLPVVSSGQTGLQAPETYRRTQTLDLLYLAGGGIIAHPSGPAAGVASLRQAWEAAAAGIDLTTYAQTHEPLRLSMQKFGKA